MLNAGCLCLQVVNDVICIPCRDIWTASESSGLMGARSAKKYGRSRWSICRRLSVLLILWLARTTATTLKKNLVNFNLSFSLPAIRSQPFL